MTGQRGDHGLPIHKPTALVSNEAILRDCVSRFVCDSSHKHDTTTGEALAAARLWTWPLANAIATAVIKVCRLARSRPFATYAYPTEDLEITFVPDATDTCGPRIRCIPVLLESANILIMLL